MKGRALDGALLGGLLTALVVSVAYLAWKLLGLPFLPFDVFDWIVRELPGSIVTFAIDRLAAFTLALPVSSMSSSAKAAEQALAIAATIGGGVVSGSVLLVVLGFSDEPPLLFGAVFGACFGVAAFLIERQLDRLPSGSIVASFWVVAICLVWGLAFGWLSNRLRTSPRDADPSPSVIGVTRRRFLIRVVCATGVPTLAAALWALLAGARRSGVTGVRWSDEHDLPNANAGLHPVPGTRRELTPIEDHYRVDIVTTAPALDPTRWRLKVGGLVSRPQDLTLADVMREPPMHQFVTLSCISNPIGGDLISTTRWTGVSAARLLDRVGALPDATHVRMTSADGFFEVVSLDLIRDDARVMFTYAWDGVPLPIEHGFPLRVYVPDLYGMKQPKWIVGLDFVNRWEPGYWVARGWDREGRVKAVSVVDAVQPGGGSTSGETDRRTIVAGGITYAGARRISRVEAKLDAGEWQEAQLREPLSDTTWVVWRADVPASRGDHTISVRCFDGNGAPQDGPFHTRRANG